MSFGGASGADFLEGRLPVFVFPTNLVFYSDDPQSHTRVITIYNPYDFPLNYKVLSTDPNKYSVTEPEVMHTFMFARMRLDVELRTLHSYTQPLHLMLSCGHSTPYEALSVRRFVVSQT